MREDRFILPVEGSSKGFLRIDYFLDIFNPLIYKILMKLITTKDIKKILKLKNNGSVIYHLRKNGIQPIEEKVVDNHFTRFYDQAKIIQLKKTDKKNFGG